MSLFSVPPANGQAPAAKVITGQYLAKASRYPQWQRAEDAVRWLRGELQIKPTVKQAAATFGVNARQMLAARERLERQERGKRFGANGGSVPGLSDDAIQRIVIEIGPERIWKAVDKITQPDLPLVAAE
jgi:hypothetical protein